MTIDDLLKRPDILAAISAQQQNPSPSVPSYNPGVMTNPTATSWPTMRGDAERGAALASGAYDPNFPNPISKTLYQIQEQGRLRDQTNIQNYQAQEFGGVTPQYRTPLTDLATERARIQGGINSLPTTDFSHYDPNADTGISVDDFARAQALHGQALAFNAKLQPQNLLTNSDALIRSQLAGDVTGTAAKILRSRMGVDTNTAGTPITPYLPSSPSGPDTLDRDIYNHPDFQQLLRTNPHQADFVYQRLTNRPLLGGGAGFNASDTGTPKLLARADGGINPEGDVQTQGDLPKALSYQANRAKFGQTLADTATTDALKFREKLGEDATQREIDTALLPQKTGREYVKANPDAVYDPIKGTWKVWKMANAPDDTSGGGLGLGKAPQPFRQLTDATPSEAHDLSTYYEQVHGIKVPQAVQYNKQESAEFKSYRDDPKYGPIIQQAEKAAGRSLNLTETIDLATRANDSERTGLAARFQPGSPLHYIDSASNALLGFKGTSPDGTPLDVNDSGLYNPGTKYQTWSNVANPDQNLNWWGKFLANPAQGALNFNKSQSETLAQILASIVASKPVQGAVSAIRSLVPTQ